MISPKAISTFLNEKRDRWDEIKQLSHNEVDELLQTFEPKPIFHTAPYLHQKACFALGASLPNFLFFVGMGGGKTRLALDLIRYHKTCGSLNRCLVVVPNVVLIASWEAEVAKHAPDVSARCLFGTTEQRVEGLAAATEDVVVINYHGLLYMATTPNPDPKKSGRILDGPSIEWMASRVDGVVFDEIHALKNHRSLSYKVCNTLSDHCSIRYGLTGTPFGRDAQDLWAQFHVIDKGQSLGRTISLYREAFFSRRKNHFGGIEHRLRKDRESLLYRFIKHRSIRYGDDEINDLPRRLDIPVPIDFTHDAARYYRQVVKEWVEEQSGYKERENSFIRMRQIASGFIGLDAQGEKIEVDLPENPKLEYLDVLIDSMPPDAKMVIFHEFTKSGEAICELLRQRKLKHGRLWSGTKDPTKQVKQFQTDKNCRFLVANSKSGGAGLNLQVANYVCFYESPVSPIVRQQAEKRCHRDGQQHPTVFIYDLYLKGSVEEKILRYLEEGKDLFEALIEGSESLAA